MAVASSNAERTRADASYRTAARSVVAAAPTSPAATGTFTFGTRAVEALVQIVAPAAVRPIAVSRSLDLPAEGKRLVAFAPPVGRESDEDEPSLGAEAAASGAERFAAAPAEPRAIGYDAGSRPITAKPPVGRLISRVA